MCDFRRKLWYELDTKKSILIKTKLRNQHFLLNNLSLIFNKKFFKREKNLNVALNRKQDCLLPFLTTSRKVSEEVKLEMIVKVFYSPVEFTLKDD